jgi:hypothetical protein
MTEFEIQKAASFKKIKEVVTANVLSSTLKQQLHDNKHITALYMSQLAYFTFDKISAKLTEFGAERMSLYNHNGTQGFFAEFNDIAVVSFRGTQLDQKEDLKTCFTFWKQDYGAVKVHKGFANAIVRLVPNIVADVEHVPETKRIYFVGHSLGGAEYLHDVDYHRIVTSHDMVRWLPPDIPYVLPYKHSGKRRVLQVPWNWNPKTFIHPHLLVTYLNALMVEENLM